MKRSNITWIVAALILGAGGIYAAWVADGGGLDAKAATMVTADASSHGKAQAANAQDAVGINPFGK